MKLNICLEISKKLSLDTIEEMIELIEENRNKLFHSKCIFEEMSELYTEMHFTPFLCSTKITDAIDWLNNNLDFKTKKYKVGCCYYAC